MLPHISILSAHIYNKQEQSKRNHQNNVISTSLTSLLPNDKSLFTPYEHHCLTKQLG